MPRINGDLSGQALPFSTTPNQEWDSCLMFWHERVCQRNEDALADIMCLLGDRPMATLKRRFGKQREDLFEEAIGEAFNEYWNNPEVFNPKRGSLESFLEGMAGNFLRNLLAWSTARTRLRGPERSSREGSKDRGNRSSMSLRKPRKMRCNRSFWIAWRSF